MGKRRSPEEDCSQPANPAHGQGARPPVAADRAWTERAILAQSPLWIAAVALVMLTGVLRRWDDAGYLCFSVAAAAPSVLVPALSRARPDHGRPWVRCYWFKLHVWVAIVVFFGTYFGTHYFFDLMGMRYAFDVRWNFESDILGHSGQRVPVFMYPLTHAYFMTYFTLLIVADRALVRWLRPGPMGRAAVVVCLSYTLAFAETLFMASSLLSDLFAYQNHGRMLLVGSFGYASYFVVGLPSVRRIDAGGELWTIQRVVVEALATSMAILILLEVWAKVIGPL